MKYNNLKLKKYSSKLQKYNIFRENSNSCAFRSFKISKDKTSNANVQKKY